MRVVRATDDFLVCDDFLSVEDCALVRRDFCNEEFRFVNSVRWVDRVYHLGDGVPLENTGYLSTPFETDEVEIGRIQSEGFARFVAALDAYAAELPRWVGRRNEDWHYYSVRPAIYPRGASLSWHDDGKNRTGAFTYYVHSTWRARWGGELLVAGAPAVAPKEEPGELLLGRHHVYDEAVLADVGTFIAPKPNRLVILRKGVVHSVRQVDQAAGDNVRASLSGFFVPKDVVAQLRK
jgi:Rps23 Pro-64 3,4-dihydroxylase Tpa1-like proline 4-hydroxylase